MDPMSLFLIGLASQLALAALALAWVQRPLRAVLEELCGAEHRARIWTRLYGLCLFVLVTLASLLAPPASGESADVWDLLATFRAGTLALLLGLGLLAVVLTRSIATHDRARRVTPEVRRTSP